MQPETGKAPNKYTIAMGELIRKARKEAGLSQEELAEEINRRPATISEIEIGKSDISIQTLLVLAIAIDKPISYFFPKSLLKDRGMDVKSPFQQKGLEILTEIEFFGDQKLTLEILKVLSDNLEEDYDRTINPENYIDEESK